MVVSDTFLDNMLFHTTAIDVREKIRSTALSGQLRVEIIISDDDSEEYSSLFEGDLRKPGKGGELVALACPFQTERK